MTTPAETPQKKRQPAVATEQARRVSGMLTAESKAQAAAALGINNSLDASSAGKTAMLPTPAKTPRKPSDKNDADIRAVARSLFASDVDHAAYEAAEAEAVEAMFPDAKKRKPKKYTGLSLDSFTAVDVDEPIQIYTDSHERVPEMDTSADNPFLGNHVQEPAVSDPPRRGRSKKVTIPGEGRQTVEEAIGREDGLVYVL